MARQTVQPVVAVVGAGIAGLAAAYYLQERARAAGCCLRTILLEACGRAGGVIATERHAGLTLERGPDSIVREKPWGLALCEELGLGPHLISTNAEHRLSFIARGNRLYPLPDGFHLLAPSELLPFAVSPLFSMKGKLRMAADLLLPRRRGRQDESLASFVRRRLGREALERVAQPMVGGIYSADPERLSLEATMPRFLDMERKHGSIIRAMVAQRRAAGRSGARGPRYDLFVSLRDGLDELPARLLCQLPEGTLQRGCRVRGLRYRQRGGWSLDTQPDRVEADAVCLALPAHESALLLEQQAPALARELAGIHYAAAATVNLVYRREAVAHPLDGFGFVVPAVEGRSLLACSFSSTKYPGRAPDGIVLLRAFVGGALFPEYAQASDAKITERVTTDLRELLGVRDRPIEVLISRYPRSMAQYHVGHLDRIARIEAELDAFPTLALAGNAYRGTGIPDCIRSGQEAAERIVGALASRVGAAA